MQELSLIRAALLSFAEEELDHYNFGEYINYYGPQRGMIYDVPGLGPVMIVDYNNYDTDKDYSGWTEELYVVFKINNKFYRVDGTYTSYIGSEWNDSSFRQVEAKEKRVIVYE